LALDNAGAVRRFLARSPIDFLIVMVQESGPDGLAE
jgi:hypothetical protein